MHKSKTWDKRARQARQNNKIFELSKDKICDYCRIDLRSPAQEFCKNPFGHYYNKKGYY